MSTASTPASRRLSVVAAADAFFCLFHTIGAVANLRVALTAHETLPMVIAGGGAVINIAMVVLGLRIDVPLMSGQPRRLREACWFAIVAIAVRPLLLLDHLLMRDAEFAPAVAWPLLLLVMIVVVLWNLYYKGVAERALAAEPAAAP